MTFHDTRKRLPPLPPPLPQIAQPVVGEDAGHHGFADRHGADADAGIVPSLRDGGGLVTFDRAYRRQDRSQHRVLRESLSKGWVSAENGG